MTNHDSSHSDHHETAPVQTSEEKGTSTVEATNAMTPINGTNGYQQQIQIDPNQPLNLSVSNASGELRVTSSDQAGVWVIVRRVDGKFDDEMDEIPVTVNVDGNTISVHPDWTVAGGLAGLARKIKDQLQNGLNPNDWDLSRLRINPDLNYDIRVEVPRSLVEGSRIGAKTASGKLSISDVTADVGATTASGQITLRNISGTVTTNSASGAVEVENITGSLEANTASGSLTVNGGEAWAALRTVSGRISVGRFTMKNARIATVSGSVEAAIVADNAQDYTVSTVSGSVKLWLTIPQASGATLTHKSASGSANVSDEWVAVGKRSWKIGDGEPGPVFRVNTVSGSLKSTVVRDKDLAAREEPLPNDATAMGGETVEHAHDTEGGLNVEAHIENLTGWAKDFAKEFGRSFAPTPPEPADSPTAPIPPVPPTLTADKRDSSTNPVSEANQSQPWTWSSGSGSPPPTGLGTSTSGQSTSPIPPPEATTPGKPDTDRQSAESHADDKDRERLQVLEALERGDIDIDEALAKLDTEDAQGI